MNTIVTTPIIPTRSTYIGTENNLDYKAICVFVAIGFFLDDDSYFTDYKVMKPAMHYTLSDDGKVIAKRSYFKWHYSPRERPLNVVVEEFAEIFEKLIKEQIGNKQVILPLSGGLDSRTQAAALKYLDARVSTYSYKFAGGHDECRYAKRIAEVCDFPFQSWTVPYGYLWKKVESLAKLNKCYAEFTHPRQMAFEGNYNTLGDIFSLGHWGDVLFDDLGVSNDITNEVQVSALYVKLVKKSGLELAKSLWQEWNLKGDFEDYLYARIHKLLTQIDIGNNANAQLRAFKSYFWATRWTATNLTIFENERPISLPYFSNEMCEFICGVPEKHLSARKIQIEYLKMRSPNLSKITWQRHRPFNLYNYKYNRAPYNYPYRLKNKTKYILKRHNLIQRNWELQFLGKQNTKHLEFWLLNNTKLSEQVSKSIVKKFYEKFKTDQYEFSHSVSMLLTLSLFFKLKENDSFTV